MVCIISEVTDLISKRVSNSAYTNPSANCTENVCVVVMLHTCVWEMPGSNLNRLSGHPIVGFSWFSTVFPSKFQASITEGLLLPKSFLIHH